MEPDQYGKYTICNVYFDTDNYELIRSSIEKPLYKEKFRIRSYGIAGKEDAVFAEIKKKFKGVVYKRRIAASWADILDFIENGKELSADIYSLAEMEEFVRRYHPKPKVFLAYDRQALVGRDDSELRLTFDQNIRCREENLNLFTNDEGVPVQEGEQRVIMELKVKDAIPLWLTKILSENKIYPGSFSKYGTYYTNFLAHNIV
jgi:SPX domain protein involved in polyphosphate accumulation